MSESRAAAKPAQPIHRDLQSAQPVANDPILLTELELVLASGGETITPWP